MLTSYKLSKVLELSILRKYSDFFVTSDLQFGFKEGFSTLLCTGTLKNTVARYLHRGSAVFSCLLDASKAFDLVDHGILFKRLIDCNLPPALTRVLLSWYKDQRVQVRWNHSLSSSFSVSNGVRQGGVLSPILFTLYVDDLLSSLERLGVGCFWGPQFLGALCYADDLALLAPSPSALRLMLQECELFAARYGLRFNASKTQLIRFARTKSSLCSDSFIFCGTPLPFQDSVVHLGHVLSYDLSDTADITSKSCDLIRKANCLLRTFAGVDPVVLTRLLRVYCLSLYGSALWLTSSKSLHVIEVAFNNILRRIWNLPARTHTGILHCVAQLQSIVNTVLSRSKSLLHSACVCPSPVVQSVFRDSSSFCFTFCGFNNLYGDRFRKQYFDQDIICAGIIRDCVLSSDVLHIIACD